MLGRKSRKPTVAYKNHRGGDDAEVAAENQHRVLPGNLLHERKHQEQRAEQQLVGDWIEILPEQRLLMQGARQQSVESVAQSRGNQQAERPGPVAIDDRNDDEGNEDQAQQRDLVRRRQELALHPLPPRQRPLVFAPICSLPVFDIVYMVVQTWQHGVQVSELSCVLILTGLWLAGNRNASQVWRAHMYLIP